MLLSRTSPAKVLTPCQLRAYEETGYLAPVPALTASEVESARAQLEAFECANGGSWPRGRALKPHLLFPFLDSIVHHPALLDAVEDIVGPDILCWSSRLFIKDPHDGGYVSWHQDLPYWGLDVSENILTAWVALSPAVRENGVMKVIPGSHRKLVEHREGVANNLLLRGQEVAVDVDETQAVFMELRAGEMSLHHGLIFHASEPNLSSERRIGFAIRYIPTAVRPLEGLPRDGAMLVRGVDNYRYFESEPRPRETLGADSVALHRHATARYAEINRLAVTKHLEMISRPSGATL